MRCLSAAFALLISISFATPASAQYAPPPRYPPGYRPPPHYPPAYYPKPDGPPYVLHGWDPDVPPPQGYELRTSPNSRLIGFGVAMLSIGYVTSSVAGLVATQEDRTASAGNWNPLFIPVVGPFVAIGSLDANAAGTGVLLADGLLQTAGLVAIITGALDARFKIVRTEVGSSDATSVEVMPLVGSQGTGMAARMDF
jgi:hypothetical protein